MVRKSLFFALLVTALLLAGCQGDEPAGAESTRLVI